MRQFLIISTLLLFGFGLASCQSGPLPFKPDSKMKSQKSLVLMDKLKDKPSSPIRLHSDLDFAKFQFNSGNYNTAEFFLKKTLLDYPGNLEANRLLPWSYFFQGRYDKALIAFKQGQSLFHHDPAPWIGMGWAQFGLRDYEKAIASLDRAEELFGETFHIRKGRGFAHLRLHRLDKAKREFIKIYSFAEMKKIISLWETWDGYNPDTRLPLTPGSEKTVSIFTLPDEKPRYPSMLLGQPAAEDPKALDRFGQKVKQKFQSAVDKVSWNPVRRRKPSPPLERAWELYYKNLHQEALDEFDDLPKYLSKGVDAQNGLAWSLLKNGNILKAQKKFEEIKNSYPGFIGAAQGLKLVEEKKSQKAAQVQYYLDLKKPEIAQEKMEVFEKDYLSWPHVYRKWPEIQNLKGWTALQQGKYNASWSYFKKAMKYDPENKTAYRGVGEVLKEAAPGLYKARLAFEKKDYKSAARMYWDYADYYSREKKVHNVLADAHLGLAWSHFYKKEYEDAVKNFKRIRKADGLKFEAARGMGASYYNMENYAEATKYFQKADKLHPNSPDVVSKLDWSILRSQKPDKSKAHFHKVIKKDPTRASAYLGLGWIEYKRSQPDLAAEYFLKAISLDPDFVMMDEFVSMLNQERFGWEIYNHLGWAFYKRGRHNKSLELFQISASRENYKSDTLKGMGYSLYRLGQYREAIAFLKQTLIVNKYPKPLAETVLEEDAITPFPVATNPGTVIGRCYLALGMFKEAAAAFSLERETRPNWPEIHDGLGWAYLRLNRLPEARIMFNKALDLQPLFYSSHKGLNAVKRRMAEKNLPGSPSYLRASTRSR